MTQLQDRVLHTIAALSATPFNVQFEIADAWHVTRQENHLNDEYESLGNTAYNNIERMIPLLWAVENEHRFPKGLQFAFVCFQ